MIHGTMNVKCIHYVLKYVYIILPHTFRWVACAVVCLVFRQHYMNDTTGKIFRPAVRRMKTAQPDACGPERDSLVASTERADRRRWETGQRDKCLAPGDWRRVGNAAAAGLGTAGGHKL